MRITTGRFRGRNISTPNTLAIRPATDRVRQTIYNMLTHRISFEGVTVLDLFAGSGSLGFEAISRGARRTTFVDNSPEAIQFLEKNARQLGCESEVSIQHSDARVFVDSHEGPYTVVFADPPYAYADTATLPALICERRLVAPGGYLIIEHAATLHFEGTALYSAGPEKKFGRTLVTFFQPRIPS